MRQEMIKQAPGYPGFGNLSAHLTGKAAFGRPGYRHLLSEATEGKRNGCL